MTDPKYASREAEAPRDTETTVISLCVSPTPEVPENNLISLVVQQTETSIQTQQTDGSRRCGFKTPGKPVEGQHVHLSGESRTLPLCKK